MSRWARRYPVTRRFPARRHDLGCLSHKVHAFGIPDRRPHKISGLGTKIPNDNRASVNLGSLMGRTPLEPAVVQLCLEQDAHLLADALLGTLPHHLLGQVSQLP